MEDNNKNNIISNSILDENTSNIYSPTKKSFPILVPEGQKNYTNTSKKKLTSKNEETKNNKSLKNNNSKGKVSTKNSLKNNNSKPKVNEINETNNIDTQNDNGKSSSRNLRPEDEILNDNNILKTENKDMIIEDYDEVDNEIAKKKQEKINNDYDKYDINANSGEGSNSNECSSLFTSKCVLVLRVILYNLIRPIYLYFLIISIILVVPSYTDLSIPVSLILYIVFIATSIIIECVEEIKAQNKLIFLNEKNKLKKISKDSVLDISGKNVQMGDVIVIKNGEVCPADMILIDSNVNSIPLYFESAALNGNFNYNVRLIKREILQQFTDVKTNFEKNFKEFFEKFREEEMKKMEEEQKKIPQSHVEYKDFLERNGMMTKQEEEKKIADENQRVLNELQFDENNKLFEELKFKQYFKYLSNHLFKGSFYVPKDKSRELYYLDFNFEGKQDKKNKLIDISQKNICYCGEKIKNAKWCLGVVIHVGDDSKPLRDIREGFSSLSSYFNKRRSVLENEINYYFYLLLTILIILSIVAGIVNMIYIDGIYFYSLSDKNRHPTSQVKNFYHAFLDYLSIMHTLIPYSIFFFLEIVLLIQKLYINNDIDLLNKNGKIITDSKKIKDLGKVDLILADKTGTLTKNERYFKYCIIGEGCYEYRNDGKPSSLNVLNKNYKKALTFTDYDMINSSSLKRNNGIIDSVEYNGFVVRSVQNPNNCLYFDRTEKLIEEFWKAISLCHDAIPVFNKNNLYSEYYYDENNKNEQKYFSNSEDNTTLVEMASKQGFTFYMDEKNTGIFMGDGTPTKTNNKFFNLTECDCEIILGQPGENTEKLVIPIRKLCHLKFNTNRKRESVIIREGNYIKLYVKGPLEEIMERVIYDYTPKELINNITSWLSMVQETGCRAFIIAMRVLTLDEYKSFLDCFKEAHNDEIDTKIRVNKVIDSIESQLTILGGCYIKDLLPKKIDEAISNIKSSGVKIWTVTGDRVSSSYNIGIATGIIGKNNDIIIAEVNQEALLELENEKDKKKKNNYMNNLKEKIKKFENEEDKKVSKEESITDDSNGDPNSKINIKKIQKRIENVLKSFNEEFINMQKTAPLITYANKFDIVIDALSYREIAKHPQNIKSFYDKAILANSITFCEFNANDKRNLVIDIKNYIKEIKYIKSYTILGIGDGFNDIGMLKECDIGVGINNGINKFTPINVDNFMDLSRLLMFHGINNLKRNTGIFELLLVRHFIFGFIYFIYGCHIFFSNVYLIPTQDIYISLFVLNLFGPFLKGMFDINLFYFYDKKEKIENQEEIEINKNNNNKDEQDKNNEYIKEMQKKEEKKREKMFKNIFDKSFKYIYLQKNQSLVESGSEHVPYKKYLSIKKFIILITKSVIFCLINFYCTYGAVESGHNIIDLSGNLLDFRRLQINLWTNISFIIFLENEIFTYFYTLLRIIEIALFVIIYLVILFMYQKKNTKQTNPFNSFLLFLNFILIVIFCSLVNFGFYIIENLYDGTVVYKLRNMKILDKHLEEMKQLVDYKEEEDEDDEDSKNEDEKNKEKESVLEIENEDNENRINKKVNSFIVSPIKDFSDEDKLTNKNQKVIVNRKNKKNPYNTNNKAENDIKDNKKLAEYFNRNLIGRKELKNQQIQDSINIMERNKKSIKDDENRKKKQLLYVNENK